MRFWRRRSRRRNGKRKKRKKPRRKLKRSARKRCWRKKWRRPSWRRNWGRRKKRSSQRRRLLPVRMLRLLLRALARKFSSSIRNTAEDKARVALQIPEQLKLNRFEYRGVRLLAAA